MEVPSLNPREVEVLTLLSVHAYEHYNLPTPHRLQMGGLMAHGLVSLRKPDTWEITSRGRAVLANCQVPN